MAYLILTKEQADQVRGRHGNYSELQPVLIPDGTYALPEDCKDHPDLKDIRDQLLLIENIQSIVDLPSLGGLCEAGKIYYDSTPTYSGFVKCVQTHNRTEHPIETIPALFSFYRENSDDLDWIENEYVEIGWKRMYLGIQYEVIQKHQTLSTWTPPETIGVLWRSLAAVFMWAIGIAYQVGNTVTYLGQSYQCLQAHVSIATWNPIATLNVLWKLVV